MKSLVGDLVVACDEIEHASKIAPINLSSRMNYWFTAVALLSVACLLLLAVIAIKYYIKDGLTIPCLFSY